MKTHSQSAPVHNYCVPFTNLASITDNWSQHHRLKVRETGKATERCFGTLWQHCIIL